jgi:outer membrane receptor protein involved in Fe transport
MLHRTFRAAVATALSFAVVAGPALTTPSAALAQVQTSITGSVTDQQTGLGLSDAKVVLFQGGHSVAESKTDATGTFAFANQAPGIYDVEVSAQGYQTSRLADQAVAPGTTALSVRIVLPKASGEAGVRVIGRVSAATRSALATTTVINRTIDPYVIRAEANLRVGDALLAQPGLTSFNLDSAPGDDLNISIRGERPSEAQLLLDGHPIGPMGVFNGTNGGFNYQLSPSFALNNVAITYGTGGGSLNGVDAIAGTIDYQTIEPTRTPQFSLTQGGGTQGRMQTFGQATGSFGKLGYAFASGVEGSYGGFAPQTVTQSGLLAGDATSANVKANTWLVSGNYLLRNDLGKLRYQFTPNTALTLGAYVATSWDDKTGEGDNDYVTPQYALYSAQQNGKTCTLSGGGTGYLAVTDSNPAACFTPAQYASTFSGPAGGTALAFQTLHMQDYDARLTSSMGAHNFVVEGWKNAYYQYYDRNLSGFTNSYLTTGARISDDIVSERNTFGFGYMSVHQVYVAGTYDSTGVRNSADVPYTTNNVFVRDVFSATPTLQLFANANVQHSSVTSQTEFDPRLSFVYNPKGTDIYRLSLGLGSEAPNGQLKTLPPTVSTQPGALNPVCGGLNSVGSSSNPNLVDERAKTIEVSYGHRFSRDSQFQAVAYDQEVNNAIFSSVLPLSSFPGATLGANQQQYFDRINQLCGREGTIADFGLTTAANAGVGRFRGIGVTERYRFTPGFFVDGGVDLISARYYGIPLVSLVNNVTLIDGGQVVGVPFMKASLGLDYTLKDHTKVRLDGYFVGRNNALHSPPYTYANGHITHPFGHGLSMNLGVSNLFNNQYNQYGLLGSAQFIPENQFGGDSTALAQEFNGNYGEQFGMPQRSVMLSLTYRTK